MEQGRTLHTELKLKKFDQNFKLYSKFSDFHRNLADSIHCILKNNEFTISFKQIHHFGKNA